MFQTYNLPVPGLQKEASKAKIRYGSGLRGLAVTPFKGKKEGGGPADSLAHHPAIGTLSWNSFAFEFFFEDFCFVGLLNDLTQRFCPWFAEALTVQ